MAKNALREASNFMGFVSVAKNKSLTLEERMALLEEHNAQLEVKLDETTRELVRLRKKVECRRNHRKTDDLDEKG
jgi:hypothetical protein